MSCPAPKQRPLDLRGVYEAGLDYVWQSLRRLGVREADLEDMAHEVFIAVRCRLGDYDPARPLHPWLFGFALRVASHYRRAVRSRREVTGGAPDAADPAPSAEEGLVALDAHRVVLQALEGIDLEQRAVLLLHDVDGCAIPEIAAVVGASVSTCYSRLRLARQKFAAAVRRLSARRGDR